MMKNIDTNISAGYIPLIEEFCRANELVTVITQDDHGKAVPKIKVSFEEDSDTAMQITYMSMIHCGFENMLWDYLQRCGIVAVMIPIGKLAIKSASDEEVEQHLKRIGLRR